MVIAIAVGGLLRALLGRLPAAAIVGVGTGLLAWLIVAPVVVALLVGIVGFIFTLAGGGHRGGMGGGGFGRRRLWRRRIRWRWRRIQWRRRRVWWRRCFGALVK